MDPRWEAQLELGTEVPACSVGSVDVEVHILSRLLFWLSDPLALVGARTINSGLPSPPLNPGSSRMLSG